MLDRHLYRFKSESTPRVTLHKILFALSLPSLAFAEKVKKETCDPKEQAIYSNGILNSGDAMITAEPTLSYPTCHFLRYVRKIAEDSCTGLIRAIGHEGCDIFAQSYVDAIKFFIPLEKKAGRELNTPRDMLINSGQTPPGGDVKVACLDGMSGGSGQVKNLLGPGQGELGSNYTVVTVMWDKKYCLEPSMNSPEGSVEIEAREENKNCNFYFVCGSKNPSASVNSLAGKSGNSSNPGQDKAPDDWLEKLDFIGSIVSDLSSPESILALATPPIPLGPTDRGFIDTYVPPDANMAPMQGYIDYNYTPEGDLPPEAPVPQRADSTPAPVPQKVYAPEVVSAVN